MEPITPQLVRQMLPPRRADGHKGTFGRVYLYGGCPDYTGAPVYAGEAAVRTGSGLVFVGVPEEVYPIAAARCRDAMVQPLPREDGALLERLQIPVVLDADGINAVSAHIDGLDGRRAVTVVTPHEGEFARLDPSFSPGAGREERERAAAAFARRHGCVVVLKGPGTIVASPDGRTLENATGNCGMAKGGSGDILAGMILSLLGQGAGAAEAAACAVWLHGRAGDLAAEELTAYAMTPTDLLGRLPAAFKELED